MAISIIEYHLIRNLQDQGYIPRGGDLLEIGEANWYGDVGMEVLRADIARFAAPEQRDALLAALAKAQAANAQWDIAKIFWQTFLQPSSITAIDMDGSAIAKKLDLNRPVQLGRQFQVVHNAGTLEHVFDIAQAFRSIHDLTAPGGLMIHHAPFVGWVDHGFYSLHPTLFWDIAEANGYQVGALVYAEINPPRFENLATREAVLELARSGRIGRNGNIAAVLQKPYGEVPFKTPMQGYYNNRISKEAVDAWSALR